MIITRALNCYNQGIRNENLSWEEFVKICETPPFQKKKGIDAVNWGRSEFELTEAKRKDTGEIMKDKSGNIIMTAKTGSRHILDKSRKPTC